MHQRFRNISVVTSMLLASTMLFTGCGGGGSSDSSAVTPPVTTKSTSITGKAVDGYLSHSLVWLDLNANGELDKGEPSDISDENGQFTLKITSEIKNDPNFSKAKIVAEGGIDKDTGENFNGKLLAPNTGEEEINLTPVTTLVAKLVEKGEDVSNAQKKVKKALKLPDNIDLFADPKELEKENQKELIAAALSLQKSIEMIAKAASGGDEEKAADIQDKLYDAFAQVLAEESGDGEEAGDAGGEEGVAGLLDAAQQSDTLKGEVDEKHFDDAKKFADDVKDAVEEGRDSGDVEKASALYMSGTVTSFDDAVSSNEADLAKKFLLYRLKILGLEDVETLAASLYKDGYNADMLIDPSDETLEKLKANEKYQRLYAALIKEQKEVEEQTEEASAEAGSVAHTYKTGDAIYEFDIDEDDGKIEIELDTHTLKADGTIGESRKIFKDGNWVVKTAGDEDYILTKDGWVKEAGNEHYTINADGSISVDDSFRIAIIKEKDISGTYNIFLGDKVLEIEMPAEAREYVNTYETTADRYYAWEKEHAWGIEGQEYYASLEEFIQHQCGLHWFDGNEDGGIAFAGVKNGDGNYVCDGSATSGKLFEVKRGDGEHPESIVSEDAGTWEIKTVNGQKILFVHPSDPKYADDDNELTIFTEFDGAVWRGDYEPKGTKGVWSSFNQSAIEAIQNAIAKAFADDDTNDDTTGDTTPSGIEAKTLFAGKTVYTPISGQKGTLEVWVFNDDFTSVTWTEVEGGSDSATETITDVNGASFVTHDGDETSHIVITHVTDTYFDFTVDGTIHERGYFDEATARAALFGNDNPEEGDVDHDELSDEEKALLKAAPIVKLSAGYKFYEFDVENEDDGIELYTGIYTLGNDFKISSTEQVFENGAWVDNEENTFILTDAGWQPEGNGVSYQINADGSMMVIGVERISVVKETDISGSYTYEVDDGKSVTLTMPEGSIEYKNTYETVAPDYYLWERKRTHGNIEGQEYYTSFKEFIEHQCGERWFVGHENGGLAFAGVKSDDGNYVCDGNAQSGTLFAVRRTENGAEIVSENGGTWEIKTVRGEKILFVHPSNPEYRDADESPIFSEYDGYLWEGAYEKAGAQDIWTSYNETAFNALKSAAEKGAFSQ